MKPHRYRIVLPNEIIFTTQIDIDNMICIYPNKEKTFVFNKPNKWWLKKNQKDAIRTLHYLPISEFFLAFGEVHIQNLQKDLEEVHERWNTKIGMVKQSI